MRERHRTVNPCLPRLQRPQFTLRACLLFMTVCAIILALHRSLHELSDDRQKLLEYQRRKLETFSGDLPNAEWAGRRMVSLQCGLAGVNPELKGLAIVPELRHLTLWFSDVSDDRMARVARLPNLQSLDIMSTPITDEGLRHLAGMTSLTKLNVSYTKITDKSLEYIATMKNLQELLVRGDRVTGEGLGQLDSLARLEVLWLDGTGVTADDVANFMRRNPRVTVYYQMPIDFREPPVPTRISDLEGK
jgi:hypothetical protein